MWIVFTFLAAFMQSWRNALQSQLSRDVKVAGVTLARFIWAGPIAACYLAALYIWLPPEQAVGASLFPTPFWGFVCGAALMQIVATGLMVKLFQLRDFAIGAGLAKSEAIVAAVFGALFFGTQLSLLGWLGVVIGAVAVLLMSKGAGVARLSPQVLLLGLACGSAFALTSLWVREASLVLTLPFPHSAAWVLLWVISVQTVILLLFLYLRDRQTLAALWRRPKLTLAISVTSCLGSIGWFSAMALQAVPYVKTLGQVEVFFTLIVAGSYLKQKVKPKEMTALLLIAVAAILVIWG
ncbi:DMT family transporter [Shewanella rhizosphaerae]|uniref:DMT family transporter n=1 Tax=Shewanella rhizosphaerae TaxID=2864207 RepID=UPI001C65FB15|nr:DMT family transporter [Shewanella rhizosphaerae]QYK12054.1 DMT family transporter [Shewanella rhizosphaerae]